MSMLKTFLCKPRQCAYFENCGSQYGTTGKKLLKRTKKEALYLCKHFEPKKVVN